MGYRNNKVRSIRKLFLSLMVEPVLNKHQSLHHWFSTYRAPWQSHSLSSIFADSSLINLEIEIKPCLRYAKSVLFQHRVTDWGDEDESLSTKILPELSFKWFLSSSVISISLILSQLIIKPDARVMLKGYCCALVRQLFKNHPWTLPSVSPGRACFWWHTVSELTSSWPLGFSMV